MSNKINWEDANDPAVKLFVGYDVEGYVEEYEFCADEGYYTPNESEKSLLIDAIYGVVSDIHEKLRALIPSSPGVEAEEEGRVGEMTPRRAVYFLKRFKSEEKMLGPNEQWALEFAIAVLSAEEPVAEITRLTRELAEEKESVEDLRAEVDRHSNAAAASRLYASEAKDALIECEDYFDNRADADCDQDGYVPNEEMKLLQVVRDAIRKAGAE